ncbi:hypothetical protein C4544_02310 [candidate division WS5 bacterium]|uniref:DUF5668 domain-containing protein n=1 Tax=candidate division WS5 bacterium TaxID=2093353 RepID=A0A419DEM9_9BACT|nr:MAG: hypothetical protein C4544_02310 [candidate division WS5 bacterium]
MKINPFRAAVGFLMLFISIILLLTTSDLVPWSIWVFVWQFWPILFVVFGVAFLMKRWNLNFFIGLPIFIVIFALLGAGLWLAWENQYFNTDTFTEINEKNLTETRISNELPKKIEETDVKIVFGTSKINIGATSDANSNFLYDGTHKSNFFTLNQRLDTFGSSADLSFKASPFLKRPFSSKNINELKLNFSQKIKYSFDISSGASDIDINLNSLNVENLDIDAGASKVVIRFDKGKSIDVKVKSGASSVKFYVPEGLGLRISTKSAFTSKNFEDFGLVEKEGTWESINWEDSKNKANIKLEAGISKVELVK